MILDDLGLRDVPLVVLDQGTDFASQLDAFGPDFYRSCWDLVVIVDYMKKMLLQTRPYEVNAGETDRVYKECLAELALVGEQRGDIYGKAAEIRDRLAAVPVRHGERRPLIGIVGEIYVRSNEFSNGYLVRKLERMGAEVVMPSLQEWLNYIAHERREICWQKGEIWGFVKEWLTEFVARWDEGRAGRIFRGAIRHMAREAASSEVIRLGSEYIHPTIKGEAILSIGRAAEYAEHGLNGVVNVVPFGCMPGAIVNGLLEKFRKDNDGIPLLKMDYDGTEQNAEETLLEAFVHQARQHMEEAREGEMSATRTPSH
jgi:predicted nucleotide-binding protein (sugar kinase/HSP70/actin superfamily)